MSTRDRDGDGDIKIKFDNDGSESGYINTSNVWVLAQTFRVGDKVQRRDGSDAWGVGFVTQLSPLKVTSSPTDPAARGFSWDDVRACSAADVRSSPHWSLWISGDCPSLNDF
eukprot:COSAG04_NODE_3382_length_2870_cov_2.066763_2_plen_112_part_00